MADTQLFLQRSLNDQGLLRLEVVLQPPMKVRGAPLEKHQQFHWWVAKVAVEKTGPLSRELKLHGPTSGTPETGALGVAPLFTTASSLSSRESFWCFTTPAAPPSEHVAVVLEKTARP